jgi:rfaE bifunctional protein kinase chain/domain
MDARHLLERMIAGFASARVVVIGDVMLDEYLHGDVHRVSPESPVPVVDLRRQEYRAGGAANAAVNLAALSARSALLGLVGDDEQANQLRTVLERSGVNIAALVTDRSRPTTQKTRVMARGHQIVRIDRESRSEVDPACEQRVIGEAKALLEGADACVLSDYDKGIFTQAVLKQIIDHARARQIPIIVDPKKRDFALYRGATLLTPNVHELEAATGATASTDDEVESAAKQLLPRVTPAALLVTRGAAGMTLVQPDEQVIHVATAAKIVFDVTGAGDTVVSVMALGLATGIPLRPLLDLANHAAGAVISKMGTAVLTVDELRAALPG